MIRVNLLYRHTAMLLLLWVSLFSLFTFPVKEHQELQLSVHMATSHVVVITFTDDFAPKRLARSPLETDASDWSINGRPPLAVHHASGAVNALPKQRNGIYPIETEYRIYLEMESPFINHERYEIAGPFGAVSLLFDDSRILCESIKVNQVGYHPDSTVRYANLGVFMGNGGSLSISPDLSYRVLDTDQRTVYRGVVAYRGDETLVTETSIASGEHVYRMDLSQVPVGGPYRVQIPGWGISYPFFITYEAIESLAVTALRGLYHQRCGTPLEMPYTSYVRDACHTEVALTKTPWVDAPALTVEQGTPTIPISGGHHDAGDFDRRPHHTLVPILLLGYFEAFPHHFTDGQLRIPESGNGLPDVLDEALWAIMSWEHLQIVDPVDPQYGGIMAGTETSGHPEYGVDTADTDTRVYGTWAVSNDVTAFGAGMMAHAARLISPYGGAWEGKSEMLLERSRIAWEYLERTSSLDESTTGVLYAALQRYLALRSYDRDEEAQYVHERFHRYTTDILIEDGFWPEQYRPGNSMAVCQTVHFSSYVLESEPLDPALAEQLRSLILKQAERGGYMGFDMDRASYPHGVTRSLGWGSGTAQGRYADVHAFAYRLAETDSERNRQFAIIAQYADYALGLNPLGVSYVTGLGSEPPRSPLHLDSWPHIQEGRGPVPGIVVYGPSSERSGAPYQRAVSDTLYPVWEDLPQQRRWADGWPLVNNNEFTIWETMVWNSVLYSVLNSPSPTGK